MKPEFLGVASLDPILNSRPIYESKILAGQSRFPSAAQGYELEDLDLNQRYLTNPPATFFFRVAGDSMVNAGIQPGAVVVVDRSIKPKSGAVVVAVVDGEMIVKKLYKRGETVKLLSENPAYAPIEFSEGQELVIWGVVTAAINEL